MNATAMAISAQKWALTLALLSMLLSSAAALAASDGGGGSSSGGTTALREAQALIQKEQYAEALVKLEQAEQQLAKLDDICFFGCDDYDALKASIAQYKQAQGM